MRCSSRYLQTIFGEPETLGRYIWRARLERCAAALGDPAKAGLSLTQIAFSLDFSNASHFSPGLQGALRAQPVGLSYEVPPLSR